MANSDCTFIMIKPDGLQRSLIGDVITRFEKKGFFLKALKMVQVNRAFAEKLYAEHASKPFFHSLIHYVTSGPVVAMVWQGKDAAVTGHKIIGLADPAACEAGTIRGDHCIDINRNLIHGSDNVQSAKREIALFFPEGIVDWKSAIHPWVYEN
jgi:nucleoside-diphosphate kinase